MGGGEHLKSDIEDLLALVPGGGRVTLTTCYGLCNLSPNMKLKSSRGNALLSNQGRLVNDGGLRMRVDEEEGKTEKVASDTVIVSEVTIKKVARVVGLSRPSAIRAIECKSAGNKAVRASRYREALQQFELGRSLCREEEAVEDDSPSINLLHAALWLSCSQCRVQWANDVLRGEEQMEMLQLAAVDAFQVLAGNPTYPIAKIDSETSPLVMDGVIDQLVHSRAGDEMRSIAEAGNIRVHGGDMTTAPKVTDAKLLVQFCIALADSWIGLAKNDDAFRDGALIAYRGALAVAKSGKKVRILRAKERRAVDKAIAMINSAP